MDQGHDEDGGQSTKKSGKQHNVLPLWGNEATMNLNTLILTNIQSSSYFKVSLFKLKTYHEVVDEIYYQVKHLEPWERGSRKTAGQTGMCGGVRGVGAGGIVSTAFCLLYKLYTLRLTRKQVNGLLSHTDSPYIRALGFMYIRYTQPPADLYDWYEDYLQDEEEIDVKAGGGQILTIGQMLRQWLVKLDWFSTLFPRIPVPIQKSIEKKLEEYSKKHNLDNRLTYAEKEMNKRREERASAYENTDERGGNGGASGNGSGGVVPARNREYYDGGGSVGGSRGDRREYDNYRRKPSRSRSREGHGSKEYAAPTPRDHRRGGGGGGGGEPERYRDDRYYSKERDYRTESYRDSSTTDYSSKYRERDRKYR